jgi:hypothetical protein
VTIVGKLDCGNGLIIEPVTGDMDWLAKAGSQDVKGLLRLPPNTFIPSRTRATLELKDGRRYTLRVFRAWLPQGIIECGVAVD